MARINGTVESDRLDLDVDTVYTMVSFKAVCRAVPCMFFYYISIVVKDLDMTACKVHVLVRHGWFMVHLTKAIIFNSLHY